MFNIFCFCGEGYEGVDYSIAFLGGFLLGYQTYWSFGNNWIFHGTLGLMKLGRDGLFIPLYISYSKVIFAPSFSIVSFTFFASLNIIRHIRRK